MDNLSLLSEIVKEQPSILYGDALKLARGNGWLLEVDCHDKSLLKAPAWRVIHQLRVSLIQADREATARELVTSPQFVETGSYKIRRTVIDSVTLKNLITLSDNYHQDSHNSLIRILITLIRILIALIRILIILIRTLITLMRVLILRIRILRVLTHQHSHNPDHS